MPSNNPNNKPIFDRFWYLLPIGSALLVIATLPPLKLWWLSFISIAPIYFFARISTGFSWKRTAFGGFLFGVIFTAFILSLTVLQFHWLKEVYLFTFIVRISSVIILFCFGVFASIQILASRLVQSDNALTHIFFASAFWTCSEWIIHHAMLGIEYSVIGYPAHNSIFVSLARYGGPFLTIFTVALVNISIGSIIYYIYQHRRGTGTGNEIRNIKLSVFVLCVCTAIAYIATVTIKNSYTKSDKVPLHIATIQYQEKHDGAFGKETYDSKTKEYNFIFPELERIVLDAQNSTEYLTHSNLASSTILIYPFSPWNGAIGTTSDRNAYDKKVLALEYSTFSKWTENFIKENTLFVTWNTAIRDSAFFNEIHYWKNGVIEGYNQKKILFPFLDYTPAIAQRIGLFTTPIDATPGVKYTPAVIEHNRAVSAIVCSELTHPIYKSNSKGSDLILAIGSEAVFTSGIANEFNIGNAVYRSVESGVPIVRSNRFGPSAFILPDGTVSKFLDYKKDGLLSDTIEVPRKETETPFEKGGGLVSILSIWGILIVLGSNQIKFKYLRRGENIQ